MKTIPLTKGYFTKVDDDDYEKFATQRWCVGFKGSGTGPTARRGVNGSSIRLHREILKAPKGIYVDHVNGDTIDNRKCNLRLCSNSQNLANRSKPKNNTSGYKGVFYSKINKNWYARINVNRRQISLGTYQNIKDAAIAYNFAAIKYFGEFAYLNII